MAYIMWWLVPLIFAMAVSAIVVHAMDKFAVGPHPVNVTATPVKLERAWDWWMRATPQAATGMGASAR